MGFCEVVKSVFPQAMQWFNMVLMGVFYVQIHGGGIDLSDPL